MALTADEIRQVARHWVRKAFKEPRKVANLDADQIKAALAAIDILMDTSQARFVAALPEPFKSATTAQEKTLGLAYVVMKRAGLI